MEAREYIELLAGRLQPYFDLEKDAGLFGRKVELFGRYSVRHAQTFLTRQDVLDYYDTFEYFLVKIYERVLCLRDFEEFILFLREFVSKTVRPKREHMCSLVNGVLVLERGMEEELPKRIRKFSFVKNYLFSFQGWSEIRIAAVDLEKEELAVSRRGRGLEKLCRIKKQEGE